MQLIKNTLLLFLCLVIIACGDDSLSKESTKERPHSPFVFRSVLDKNPRMVTIAMSDEIWAAYSAAGCNLYKAWQGNVNLMVPFTILSMDLNRLPIGNAYMENKVDKVWALKDANGIDQKATIAYKGHKIVSEGAVLMFEMDAPGLESPISITEQPEASISESNQPIFERTFTTQNVPQGYTVLFSFNTNSIIVESNVSTDGKLTVNSKKENQIDKKTILELNGTLALNSNATTSLNTTFVASPAIINPLNLGTEEEEGDEGDEGELHPGARLIAKNDCKTCHNKNVKTIGPAYVAIAKNIKLPMIM